MHRIFPSPNMTGQEVQIRCYGELNDFLAPDERYTQFPHAISGSAAIEEVISALGLPSAQIDLVLVNGRSVGTEHRLLPQDRVSLYPVFQTLNISSVTQLQGRPLRRPRFVLDVHLGKLARLLRMLGFDALWRPDYTDPEILAIAQEGQRILLSRDRALIESPSILRGIRIVSQRPTEQAAEVLVRLDLASQLQPFSRCMVCNGLLVKANKEQVQDRLPPRTRERYTEFRVCMDCQRIYWEGSHYGAMISLVRRLTTVIEPLSS